MNYIQKHWRGDLSLSQSFWVNGVLLNIAVASLDKVFSEYQLIEHPVIAARFSLSVSLIALCAIYPWQVIGLWRSAKNHIRLGGRAFVSRLVQVLIILGFAASVAGVISMLPVYKDLWRIAYDDPYDTFTVTLVEEDGLVHVQGPLGFGVSDEVEQFLEENAGIAGVVLDSEGGRIFEGRALYSVIDAYELDTYTLKGCYSACTIAFVAGKSRRLALGANLGFHRYSNAMKSLEDLAEMGVEEELDRELFLNKGVSRDFVLDMYRARSDDMWFPSMSALLEANVIDEVVPPSRFMTQKNGALQGSYLEQLESVAAMRAVRKYEPEVFQKLLDELERASSNGASPIEIKQLIGMYVESLAGAAMPRTSNKALLAFAESLVLMLKDLNSKSPITCVKYLYPAQYGPAGSAYNLSAPLMDRMLEALNLVLVDSYSFEVGVGDFGEGEATITRISSELADELSESESRTMTSQEDYAKTCNTVITYYERILEEPPDQAAKAIRFALSP